MPWICRSSAVCERKNRSKSRSRSSSGMPIPVSDDLEADDVVALRQTDDDAPAGRRELDRVRDEVVEELCEPHRLAVDRGDRLRLAP